MVSNEEAFVMGTSLPTECQGRKRSDTVKFRHNRESPAHCSDKGNNSFEVIHNQPSTSGLNLNVGSDYLCGRYDDSSSEDEGAQTFTYLRNVTEQNYRIKNKDRDKHKVVESRKCQSDSIESNTENMPKLDLLIRHFDSTVDEYSSESETAESEDNVEEGIASEKTSEWTDMIHKAIAICDKTMHGFTLLEKKLCGVLAQIAERRQDIAESSPWEIKKLNWRYYPCFFRKDTDNSLPPPNEDFLKMKTNSEVIMRYQPPFTKWTPIDKSTLKTAVIKVMKMNGKGLIDVENEPDNVWKRISGCLRNRHSAMECRGMWINHILPSIMVTQRYTKREGLRLEQIAEKHRHQDWDAIASDLNTGRSGLQCFILYTIELERRNKYMWSKEEDEKLLHLVNKHRNGDKINWTRISCELPGRDSRQVSAHWKFTANPEIKKGKFTKEEDLQMFRGIRLFGTNFPKIVRHFLPKRTSSQVRSHYLILSSVVGVGKWSQQEDKALLYLANKYKEKKWSDMAKHFIAPTRTARQIRTRYQTLKRWSTEKVVAWRRQSRQLQSWLQRKSVLKDLTEYSNSNLEIKVRGCRKPRLKSPQTQVDRDIAEVLEVNFLGVRTGRGPESRRRVFTLTDEEVEARALVTKHMFDILRINLDIPEEIILDDPGVSHQDKMVLVHIMKQNSSGSLMLNQQLESTSQTSVAPENVSASTSAQGIELESVTQETKEEGGASLELVSNQETPCVEAMSREGKAMSMSQCAMDDHEPSASVIVAEALPMSQCAMEDHEPAASVIVADISPEHLPPQPSTSTHVPTDSSYTDSGPHSDPSPLKDHLTANTHPDFLLPDRGTLFGLSDILVSTFHNRTIPKTVYGSGTELQAETLTAAKLWMERLKTVFVYPIALPPEIVLEEARKVRAEKEKERERQKAEEEHRKSLEVVVTKKLGRPRKKRRKIPSNDKTEPPPKRVYKRSGKYSTRNNITPRINLQRTSKKEVPNIEVPIKIECTDSAELNI